MKKLNLSSRISSHFMSYLLLGLILPGGQFKTYDLQAADLAPSLAQQCAELLVQQGPRALPPAVTLEDISNTVSDHDRSTLLWEHYFSTPIDYSLATAWEELFNKSDILFDNSKKDERKITSQVATKVARMYWQNPAAAKAFFSQKIQEQFLGYAKFVDDNQGWKRHYVILRILHKAFQETNLMSQLAPTFQAGAVNAIRILFQNCLWSAEAFIVGREHLKQIIPEFIWPQRISAPQDLQIINNSLALLFPSLDQLESFPAKELAHLLAPLVDRTALVGPSPLKQLLAEKDKDDASASSDAFSAKKNDGPSPMDILISTLEDYAENKKMDAKELRRSVKFYLNLKLPEFTAEDLINDNFFQVIRTSPFSHLILENQYFRDEQLPSLINHPHFI
ncbi:MAG: hypothetical protein J6Y94_05435 [Bacteriovoracaceae bacterium]|nr:hypothetical protein [Bacteriovoracaceae bacterium]